MIAPRLMDYGTSFECYFGECDQCGEPVCQCLSCHEPPSTATCAHCNEEIRREGETWYHVTDDRERCRIYAAPVVPERDPLASDRAEDR